MNILYVITQGETGGAQKYVATLAKAAKEQNMTVNVAIGESGDNWLTREIEAMGGKIWLLNHLKRNISLIHDFLGILELAKLYHKIKPDIIHLNSSKAGILGSLGAIIYKFKNENCKIIYTVHGWVFNESIPWLKKQTFYWLEKITAIIKDKIICVSEYDRQMGIKSKVCNPNKLITINNGIDLLEDHFIPRQKARKMLGLDFDSFIIGNISNFYKTKGLNFLIEAFEILIKKNINKKLKLVFIGDGELRPQIEEQIKKSGLTKEIILLGRINQGSKFLKAFDIFVMSSIKEGFPYALIEAQFAGLPIISTNVGGIPEIISNGTNGLLIESKNVPILVAKIQQLINDDVLSEKLKLAGIKTAKEKFTLQKMISKTFDLYQK